MDTQYFKTRRGIGTERQWQPTDWLIVDAGYDGEIVGYEILGDHTQLEALVVIVSKAHIPSRGSAPVRLARYECLVHAADTTHDGGTPVGVIAATPQEAADRAIALGWSGRENDAQVTVLSIADQPNQ